MDNQKQVLVTGASSILMQQTCAKLLNKGFEFTGISRSKKNINPSIYTSWIAADLATNIDTVDLAKYNSIIHAAACTHGFSYKDYATINVDATNALVAKAKQQGVSNFIYISSRTAVKGGGWYAATKLEAENIILKNFPNALIIRPAEVYGGTKQEGIDAFIEQVKTKKFIVYPSGVKDKMYPISLDDATTMMANSIANNEQGINYVNGPEGFTLKEFLQAISKSLNKQNTLIPIHSMFIELICFKQQFFKLPIGVYPDQMKRLKVKKEHHIPPSFVKKITENIF
ncbi:MAG: NAD-dependent epimerase/dehydratase family protein [Chitinophagaceae bacterium]